MEKANDPQPDYSPPKLEMTTEDLRDLITGLTIQDDKFMCEICQMLLYDPVACHDCD